MFFILYTKVYTQKFLLNKNTEESDYTRPSSKSSKVTVSK